METIDKLDEYLKEGSALPKNWKDDPWGARDKLWMRATAASKKINDIYISETKFFYDVDKKHIDDVGKKLKQVEKGVLEMEKITHNIK